MLTAAVAIIAAVALAGAPAAEAGEYTVYTCRLPDGNEAGIGAWRFTEGEFPSILGSWETCPEGAYSIVMSADKDHPADHWTRTTFFAPSNTQISS